LRPLPLRRVEPEGANARAAMNSLVELSSSCIPATMVFLEMPVAATTCATPPRPNTFASTAAKARR
jgi:hypothetical protein